MSILYAADFLLGKSFLEITLFLLNHKKQIHNIEHTIS